MSQKFHVETYAEADDNGKWHCHVDLSSLVGHFGGLALEQTEGIRVGPFASRQLARRELRGHFRDLVVSAVREFLRQHGGSIHSFSVNERRQEDSN